MNALLERQQPVTQQVIRASQFQTKIRHLEEIDVVQKFEIALSRLYITLGFSKPPEQIEVIAVAQSLKKYHSMLTVEEIIVALEMNVAGLLGETIQHYQLFSVEYVTSVFSKFLDHKYEVMKKFTQELGQARKLEEPKRASPEETYNFIKKFVDENKTLPMTADWSSCFDWMWSQKLTESTEELKAFFDKHSKIYIKNIKSKIATSTNFVEKQALELQISESAVKNHVRKVWVQLYFQNTFKT